VRALLVFAAAMMLPNPGRADMIDTSGMAPWEVCALCHSLDGISRMPKFPKLAGQPAPYIEKQLSAFRSGVRTNDGGQMAAIADGVPDAVRPVVAAYFAGLKPPPPVPLAARDPAVDDVIDNGLASASVPACMSCHAPDRIAASGAPRLEAQHAPYIAKQLRDFREGRRDNDPNGVMRAVAGALPETLIEPIAQHLAARER